jgi:dolichol-phosphate mannosyltransferase
VPVVSLRQASPESYNAPRVGLVKLRKMSRKRKLSLILPTLNEAEHIIDLIERITGEVKKSEVSLELIVVDDDSKDGTWRIVEEYKKNKIGISILRRTKEKGLTSALNDGIGMSEGDLVGWLDCDFQHPPELLPALIKAAALTKRVAVASRYVGKGNDQRTSAVFGQKLLSSLISLLCRIALGIRTKDITSGYIVIKKEYLNEIGKLNGSHGEYFIDLIFRLEKQGYMIEEVPYSCGDRKTGISKTANSPIELITRGIPYLRTLLRLRLSKIEE